MKRERRKKIMEEGKEGGEQLQQVGERSRSWSRGAGAL